MVIWMIFTILSVAGLAVSVGLAINNCIDKERRKFKKKIPWILISLALCVVCCLTMYHGSTDHTGDGERVAMVYDEDTGEHYPLYYSEKTNEYFIVQTNLFNVVDLTERKVINHEIAKQYVEAYKKLHSIDMKEFDIESATKGEP